MRGDALGEHVRCHLRVELDEGRRLGRVLGRAVAAEEDLALGVELLGRRRNLLARPVDRGDLLAEQTEHAELVRRALLLGDVARDLALARLGVELWRRLVLLLVLGDLLGGELEELGLGALELLARLLAAVVQVGELLEVTVHRRRRARQQHAR